MAGGGVIGGASAAGLALSPGMVGLLLLAAFGVYYIADNADAIGRSLEVVLEAEATNTELSLAAQAEYAAALTSWWESAKAGAIDLVSAPEWIADVITGWVQGFFDGGSITQVPVSASGYPAPSLGAQYAAGTYVALGPNAADFVYLPVSSGLISYYKWNYAGTQFTSSYIAYSTSGNAFYTQSVIISGVRYYFRNGVVINATNNDAAALYASMQPYMAYCFFQTDSTTPKDILAGYLGGTIDASDVGEDVYPSVITGGISDQLSSGIGMDVIGLPDIVIPGPDVLPVNPSEGQTTAQAVTDYLMAALIAGEITWEQYWQLIGVYNPAIGSSVPTVGTVDPVTGTITNTEISTGVVVTPSPIQNFHLDLTSFFPFCIPFDLFEFIRILCAEPEAPVFYWEVQDLAGNVYGVDVDLSPWNSHAQLFRDAQCLLFIIGLLMLTRKFIKW